MIRFKKMPLEKRLQQAVLVCSMICLVMGCRSSQQIVSSGEHQGWALVKTEKSDDPSWAIYSRQLDGTNFYEYKITGSVAASGTKSASTFRADILAHAEGSKVDKKLTTYKLLDESEDSLLTYVIHNEPFPLKDTEMCIRYHFITDANGTAIVKWKEAWGQCGVAPSKRLQRVETFRGEWQLTPTSNNTCTAVNTVQFDPKKMPLWLVNPMVVKFLR